jgi:hypothetical protein
MSTGLVHFWTAHNEQSGGPKREDQTSLRTLTGTAGLPLIGLLLEFLDES